MKITVYTQVYNTKPYLEQCILSVLNQTYADFEFLIIDNGCTDGSSKIIKKFKDKDRRIKLIKYDKNQNAPWFNVIRNDIISDYVTRIDSDDWWEPDYLERMIVFLEKNGLDIAVTGTINYFEQTKASHTLRKLDEPIVMSIKQFSENYSKYWTFPSTLWGHIAKTSIFRKTDLASIINEKLAYGADTLEMLEYMKNCRNIGIDNTALYHYRIHPKGVSYQYNPKRFDANIMYYEKLRDFLVHYDALDAYQQKYLKLVHITSMDMTLDILLGTDIPAGEKLKEAARIAGDRLTDFVLQYECKERTQWCTYMRHICKKAFEDKELPNFEHLYKILSVISPDCARILTDKNLPLFKAELVTAAALINNDKEELASCIFDFIEVSRYTKQYDLVGIMQKLAEDDSPLKDIGDALFMRKYGEIYRIVWNRQYGEALDIMTDILFENRAKSAKETFLNLYLTLSAMLGEVSAFIFGNVKTAELYLQQKRFDECGEILLSLDEMGIEENEDITAIRLAMENAE